MKRYVLHYRGQIPAAAIRKLSWEALSQAFIESGPLQIFISCTIFINWSLMSAVDITVIYCLSWLTNLSSAPWNMNIESLITFIYIVSTRGTGGVTCVKGPKCLALSFVFMGVMITLTHMQRANKVPWRRAQCNIFPGISLGLTSVCQACWDYALLSLHLQRYNYHKHIVIDKWVNYSSVLTL